MVPKVQHYISVVAPDILWGDGTKSHPGHLNEAGKQAMLRCGITGVDLRLPQTPTGPYWRACVLLARDVAQAGLELTTTRWEGERVSASKPATADANDGVGDADDMIAMVDRLRREAGADVVQARNNAESDVWSGNPRANDYLQAYYMRQAARAHALGRGYVGYYDPRWHYGSQDVDGDGLIDGEIWGQTKAWIDEVHVMAYGSSYTGLLAALQRARAQWPRHPFSAYAGVGRIDKKQGIVGNFEAWKRLCVENPTGLRSVTWYVGYGAENQVLVGHPGHPPIVRCIPEILKAS